jgi:L-threonylcarbamoyladenylate synthase
MIDFKADIHECARTIKNGGIILYPTDTVWGLGCDARNEEAVQRIFKIKNREDQKSLLVLVEKDVRIEQLVKDVPEVAWDIVDNAEEPITIVYPGARNVAKNLIAEDGSLGIRLCKDAFCSSLIHTVNRPLVSTSANFSGQPTPTNFGEISPELIKLVDYVVEYRQKDVGKSRPSSIIRLGLDGRVEILRK